jgi:hypothetical protein
MFSRLAFCITAVALALSAQASVASPAGHKGCKANSHQHAKVAATKPVKQVQRGGGGAGAQLRRSPDIQILSFGP